MSSAESQRVCVLPGGLLDEHGVLHREAELAPLTGDDEELLTAVGGASSAELVTRILGRCVARVGAVPVTIDVARRLLVADRQVLLLRIRELTFGDRCTGTLTCPWPGCTARVDIDFSTRDIPVRSVPSVARTYALHLSDDALPTGDDGELPRTLTFRLPNGADQEDVAHIVAGNPAGALTQLLERCVIGSDPPREDVSGLVRSLSPRARQELERALEEHSPSVDLEMELKCPECGRGFTAPLDLTDFFFGELRISRDLLYRQVHYIAFHYHWSEREIMTMPRDKRLAYIDILAEEIEAINNAS